MITPKPINILKASPLLALLMLFSSTTIQADTYKTGIAKTTDGIVISGSILFNPLTPGFVSILQFNAQVSTFTASQLEYFQIEGENPYVSRTIFYRNREQKVFLEKAVSGKLTYLYMKHSQDRFFVEGHEMVELTAANILEELNTLAPGCARWQRQMENSRLHHRKVRFIAEEINKGKCRNIPFLAAGITASGVMAGHSGKIAVEGELPLNLDKNENNFSVALFLDIPLWKIPYTHLRFQAGLYRHQFSQTSYTDPTLYRVATIQRTDMMAEILPMFQLNTEILRPYIFAGPAININLDNKSEMVKRTATQDGIKTSLEQINLNTFSTGVTVGVGIKYHYRPESFIAIEIKNSNFSFGNEHKFNLWQAGISANIISF